MNSQQIINLHRKILNAKTKSTRTRYINQLKKVESNLRRDVNRRMTTLRKRGLDYGRTIQTGYAFIEREYGENATKFKRPEDFESVYEQTLVMNRIYNSPQSLVSGILKSEQKRERALAERGFPVERIRELPGGMRGFWRWIESFEISEFFQTFSPSPQDSIQGTVAGMVYDLYAEGGTIQRELNQLFEEYALYRRTQDDRIPQGINTGMLIDRMDRLYESIGKRRRI